MAGTAASTRLRYAVLIASLVCTVERTATAQAIAAESRRDSTGRGSHVRSAAELASFLVLLNGYDRLAFPNQIEDGKKVFSSTFTTSWDHLREERWVHDRDPFNVNQFGHPYQGATMYGLVRASGQGFWTSLVYADVGSFAWEIAGETTQPSINDLITTGQAGSLLGEALYRMSDLVLKDNPGGKHFWHSLLADVISPPRAVNRRALGSRFSNALADSAPATSWQVRLGATADALARDHATPGALLNRDAVAEFSMSYGLPGKPGYDYDRPLDYFDFQASFLSNSSNPIENVMIRGLLKGTATGETSHSRGIWGLYGTYDYISPYLFRVSSTALSLGTTQQVWIARGLALQSSLLGGVGYGAAGTTTVIPSTSTSEEIRDYHFGVTPQALLALRFIAGDRVMLDADAREYYVSGLGSDDVHGSETVFRGNAGASVRIIGGHTLGVRYVASTRDARYGKFPDRRFSEGTVTIAYSFLGANQFGAVKWP
jgi:hypothetical protein